MAGIEVQIKETGKKAGTPRTIRERDLVTWIMHSLKVHRHPRSRERGPVEAAPPESCRGFRANHSYRYAWAERAKQCGYPERFAQEALGHNNKAVHRAYARRAQVKLPSLESYERQAADGRIIQLPQLSPATHHNGQKVG